MIVPALYQGVFFFPGYCLVFVFCYLFSLFGPCLLIYPGIFSERLSAWGRPAPSAWQPTWRRETPWPSNWSTRPPWGAPCMTASETKSRRSYVVICLTPIHAIDAFAVLCWGFLQFVCFVVFAIVILVVLMMLAKSFSLWLFYPCVFLHSLHVSRFIFVRGGGGGGGRKKFVPSIMSITFSLSKLLKTRLPFFWLWNSPRVLRSLITSRKTAHFPNLL